jgi:hypothetical protein
VRSPGYRHASGPGCAGRGQGGGRVGRPRGGRRAPYRARAARVAVAEGPPYVHPVATSRAGRARACVWFDQESNRRQAVLSHLPGTVVAPQRTGRTRPAAPVRRTGAVTNFGGHRARADAARLVVPGAGRRVAVLPRGSSIIVRAPGLPAHASLRLSAEPAYGFRRTTEPGTVRCSTSSSPRGHQAFGLPAVSSIVAAAGLPHQNRHPRRRRSTSDAPSDLNASA